MSLPVDNSSAGEAQPPAKVDPPQSMDLPHTEAATTGIPASARSNRRPRLHRRMNCTCKYRRPWCSALPGLRPRQWRMCVPCRLMLRQRQSPELSVAPSPPTIPQTTASCSRNFRRQSSARVLPQTRPLLLVNIPLRFVRRAMPAHALQPHYELCNTSRNSSHGFLGFAVRVEGGCALEVLAAA